jgi:phosphatidate cytidylyltransferase
MTFMVEKVLGFTVGCFSLGALVLHGSSARADEAVKRQQWIKYLVYFLIVHLVIGSALAGPLYVTVLMSVVVTIGAYELVTVCTRSRPSTSRLAGTMLFFAVYAVLALGTIRFSRQSSAETILFVYLVTSTFDGFSQVVGQSLGRTPLAPRVSPNKTVEGFVGGLTAATGTAVAFKSLAGFSSWEACLAGSALSVVALAGDLAASYVKRLNNVKDFGELLPGHGGILDRFDSLLSTAPACFLWTTRFP